MRTGSKLWVFWSSCVLSAACLPASGQGLFTRVSGGAGERVAGPLVRFDVEAMRAAADGGAQAGNPDRSFTLADFPLRPDLAVDLRLRPLPLVGERTRFLVGTADGLSPYPFDPAGVALFTGDVPGCAGSHVFLAFGRTMSVGRVELGPGRASYTISAPSGDMEAAMEMVVTPTRAVNGPIGMLSAWCGVEDAGEGEVGAGVGGARAAPREASGPMPVRGMRQVEQRVIADHELFLILGDEMSTYEYMLLVYGAASDIMTRDLKARLDLVEVIVWTEPDPYGPGSPIPFNAAGADITELLSGIRGTAAGGSAFLCGTNSQVHGALGYFGDTVNPMIHSHDVRVVAHELGHNVGGPHTHDIGVDQCHVGSTTPRRGTILSYCSQSFSGGDGNSDLRFHTAIQARIAGCMEDFNRGRGVTATFAPDCNQNGVFDEDDIAMGVSADLNANGIPDECEDCNGNMVLDDEDIAAGTSLDLNENGVPDECEPDCNGNGVPDDLDISTGASEDLNGNGVLDSCEADCNTNGVSDHLEITADMSLDVNRNAVLDGCENCDGDEFTDFEEIDGAGNLWAAVPGEGRIKQYHGITGVLVSQSEAVLMEPSDVLITADARVLVTSTGDGRVVEFDRRGGLVGDLVTPGSGGLDAPGAMALSRRGTLMVASTGTDEVLEYDLNSGAFLGTFVTAGSGGLVGPYGLAVLRGGNLLVTSAAGEILEFDGDSGALERVFATSVEPSVRDILVLPDGTAIAAAQTNEIHAFDGATGDPLGVWNNGTFGGRLQAPWGLAIGPSGDLYVSASGRGESHLLDPRVHRYNAGTGTLIYPFVHGLDSRLNFPRGIDFLPSAGDCNLNLYPDECDILHGLSQDANGNGVPDECETCYADCDQSTGPLTLDIFDFLCFQDLFVSGNPSADCDGNGRFEIFDFLCFQDAFAVGCG